MDPTPERIGRCLLVGIRGAHPDDPRFRADLAACREAGVGGVVLFTHDAATGAPRNITGPEQLARLVRTLRAHLGADLIVAIDQEGGTVARLTPRQGFEPAPSPEELGQMTPAERQGVFASQARQLAEIGITLNLAPCVDLALAPTGPIASRGRAFGADPDLVVACAADCIEAHRRVGVRCCVKHFPGHGSSTGDSHDGLTDVGRVWQEIELEPYRRLLTTDAPALVMVGHLVDRRVDADHPASLSAAHIRGTLREQIGWKGPVVTDSLDMGAITARYGRARAIELALRAGADLILDGANLGEPRPRAALEMRAAIEDALAAGRLPPARLAEAGARVASL